ncbi:hypothetical protein JTE90_021828 [Oedothorax gibbosus]|uniref:SET domain-containing protein n=1 Tax=Oedothorax gibbosus TaxID=931172 RepID=A0AAV6UYJ4_9ARAC|nr:hypothetical protein JTE90_021828 [Oedothorax gibbosus]
MVGKRKQQELTTRQIAILDDLAKEVVVEPHLNIQIHKVFPKLSPIISNLQIMEAIENFVKQPNYESTYTELIPQLHHFLELKFSLLELKFNCDSDKIDEDSYNELKKDLEILKFSLLELKFNYDSDKIDSYNELKKELEISDVVKQSLKKYVIQFLRLLDPATGFKVETCTRYTGDNKMGVKICATKKWFEGEHMQYLVGTRATLKDQDLDFNSILYSSLRKEEYLWLGPAAFLNHDCEPNCKIEPKNGEEAIVVIRNIDIGEEITVLYGRSYFGENNKDCECITCERNLRGSFISQDHDSQNGQREMESQSYEGKLVHLRKRQNEAAQSKKRRGSTTALPPPKKTCASTESQLPKDNILSYPILSSPTAGHLEELFIPNFLSKEQIEEEHVEKFPSTSPSTKDQDNEISLTSPTIEQTLDKIPPTSPTTGGGKSENLPTTPTTEENFNENSITEDEAEKITPLIKPIGAFLSSTNPPLLPESTTVGPKLKESENKKEQIQDKNSTEDRTSYHRDSSVLPTSKNSSQQSSSVLPTQPQPSPAAEAPLPSPAAEAPLPSPAAEAPLPSPAAGAPLPSPAAGAPLPSQASQRSYISYNSYKFEKSLRGLPSPAAGAPLPSPAAGAPLPYLESSSAPPTKGVKRKKVEASKSNTDVQEKKRAKEQGKTAKKLETVVKKDQQNAEVFEYIRISEEKRNQFRFLREYKRQKPGDSCFYSLLFKDFLFFPEHKAQGLFQEMENADSPYKMEIYKILFSR